MPKSYSKEHVHKQKESYTESTPKRLNWRNESVHIKANGEETVTTNYYGRTWTNTVEGERNPCWKHQVKQGYNAGTNFVGYSESTEAPTFFGEEHYIHHPRFEDTDTSEWTKYKSTLRPVVSSNLASLDPSVISETKANNEALARLVQKIHKTRTHFNGGVFAGELAESISLLRNPARGLREGISRFLDAVKKPRPRDRLLPVRRKREILADQWLEYSFGWRPLMNDINEGAEALANHYYKQPVKWKPVRGYAEDRQVTNRWPNYSISHVSLPRFYTEIIRQSVCQVRYISCVDLGSYLLWDEDTGAPNLEKLGLHPSQFAIVGWELLPWSFLIDYFTNVGNIIQASSILRSNVRWTLKTVRKSYEQHYKANRMEINTTTSQDMSIVPGYFVSPTTPQFVKRVERAPYSGSLVPQFEFSLPNFGTKWINMSALFAGRRNLRRTYLTE